MNSRQHDPVQLDIKIQMTVEAIQKLWTWTDLAKGEFSALGIVDEVIDPDTGTLSTLRVTDFYLVKQICSDMETELYPFSVSELMMNLEARGLPSGKLRCWVHSHGDMGVFWSGQDNETIEGLSNDAWLLSLVVNRKRQAMMRLDMFYPTHLYVQDIVWEICYPQDGVFTEQCLKEFREKVTEGQI